MLAAVVRFLPGANQTAENLVARSAWTLTGVRDKDDGIFATNGSPFGLATVHLAYSVSKPLDFEFSDEVQLTMAAEVFVKVAQSATGLANASWALSSLTSQNWTTVALPVATQRVNFEILDSPVSWQSRQLGLGLSSAGALRLPMPLNFVALTSCENPMKLS